MNLPWANPVHTPSVSTSMTSLRVAEDSIAKLKYQTKLLGYIFLGISKVYHYSHPPFRRALFFLKKGVKFRLAAVYMEMGNFAEAESLLTSLEKEAKVRLYKFN